MSEDLPGIELPEFKLDFMNQDHDKVLALITRLKKLLNLKNPREMASRIDSVMQEMIEHHHQHFAHEDQEMVHYQYPEADVHLAEHGRVLKDLEAHRRHWLQHRDIGRLNDYLSRRYPCWLMDHLVNMDVEFANFLLPLERSKDSDEA